MSDRQTPTDPDQLRAEIERTRAELGDTVQELAAKADVKTRAKQAVGTATGRARQKLARTTGAVKQKASTAREQLADSELPAPIRRPRPLGAFVAAAAVVVTVVVMVRRRRA